MGRKRTDLNANRERIVKAVDDVRPKVTRAVEDMRPKVTKAVEDAAPKVEKAAVSAGKFLGRLREQARETVKEFSDAYGPKESTGGTGPEARPPAEQRVADPDRARPRPGPGPGATEK